MDNEQMLHRHLIIGYDMHGCPNRCRHCWLGDLPDRPFVEGRDDFIVESFRRHFKSITFYSWIREPDFCPDYRSRWIKDNALSSVKPVRFELASFYKIVRDPGYVEWLKGVGTRKVQLTFFGLEATTDRFVGRKGAYGELMKASETLKRSGIEPRWQIFLYETNKEEALKLLDVARAMGIKDIFVHEGSCDGNNRKLYGVRINKHGIPDGLRPYYPNLREILSEKECVERLRHEESPYVPRSADQITLYITSDLNVYYNFTSPSPAWKIGNIEEDGVDRIVARMVEEDIPAMRLAKKTTLKDLACRYGDENSDKAFLLDDYKMYLLNSYLDESFR